MSSAILEPSSHPGYACEMLPKTLARKRGGEDGGGGRYEGQPRCCAKNTVDEEGDNPCGPS